MSQGFELHTNLKRDCVEVTSLKLSRVLLMNDANYPWLILVPQVTGKRDFHELEPPDQYRLCDEITKASNVLGELFRPYKVNVAALGNMTPQLHLHIVARFRDDPAWPAPVWSRIARRPYERAQLTERVAALAAAFARE